MVKAIIFDMDGTMFDTEPLWEKAFINTGKELGYNFTKELRLKTIGINNNDLKKLFKNEMGKDFPFQIFSERYMNNMNMILKNEIVPIKKGLLELIDYLRDNGYTMAIASSTNLKIIKRNLRRANIDEKVFKVIVSGEDFKNGKPNPEIFIKTCELLKVEYDNAIVIEDSNNGIKAAYMAGCIPVLIPDIDIIKEETKKMAKYEFKSLLDVILLLERT